MRYCPFCHRINIGRPQLCNYCGHTWYVRLCPRGHENPADSQFCGTCGSADLTDTVGPRPWWLWLMKIFLFGALLALMISILSSGMSLSNCVESLLPLFLPICILLTGWYLAMTMLPGPGRRLVQAVNRSLKRVCVSCLVWLWEKIKSFY
jgi:hypothetical protein